MQKDSPCLVLNTCPDWETAERIATTLVSDRLAACATILPGARSIYRWEGKIEQASEVQVLIKTRFSRVAALTERLKALHPYEVPEIIAVQIHDGLPEYIKWLRTCTE